MREKIDGTLTEVKKKTEAYCKSNIKIKDIGEVHTPYFVDSNENYEKKLKKELEKYVNDIDGFWGIQKETVDEVKKICQKVQQSFEAKRAKKEKEAERIVSEILAVYKNDAFAVSELDQSYAFRGVAPFRNIRRTGTDEMYATMMEKDLNFFRARVSVENEVVQTVSDINYLPYSKRYLAQDTRFGLKGKVCLYLGTTSYVCAKECRWKEDEHLYMSSFKFNEKGKKLKILNLAISPNLLNGFRPLDKNDIEDIHIYDSLVKIMPLVIATMFTRENSDTKGSNEAIKYEYFLSQILMNVLQQEGIDGVAYLSRQLRNEYPYTVCLAIPIVGADDENEYGNLIECYEMTDPISFDKNRIGFNGEKRSYINEIWYQNPEREFEGDIPLLEYNEEEKYYRDMPFSYFDDYLINQKHTKFEGA